MIIYRLHTLDTERSSSSRDRLERILNLQQFSARGERRQGESILCIAHFGGLDALEGRRERFLPQMVTGTE